MTMPTISWRWVGPIDVAVEAVDLGMRWPLLLTMVRGHAAITCSSDAPDA
jgi:hypothetical protein